MLEKAKAELESRGMAVLGGYICPDHDEYVSSKIRSKSLTAAERLELCELAVEDRDWLMVDRWAGIYASSAVAYTTIVDHIDKMVNHHVRTRKKIKIVYAFGGDNAMFAYSFTVRWSCICVLRPGSVGRFRELLKHDSFRDNPRIMYSEDMTAPLDSTSVRKGDLSGLLPKVKARYLAMRNTRARSRKVISPSAVSGSNILYLRNEGLFATSYFEERSKCSTEQLLEAYQTFCELLQVAFELALNSTAATQPAPEVIPVQLKEQEPNFRKLLQTHERVISLDPCLLGTTNLRLTQTSKPLVKPSPNSMSISGDFTFETRPQDEENVEYTVLTKNLPLQPGAENLIAASLPENGTVKNYISLAEITPSNVVHTSKRSGTISKTTIDARDFLIGSHESGTPLQLGESQLVQVPYVLPYVRPSHYVHIATTAEMGFSYAIWELNQQFFKMVGDKLSVGDMAPDFQKLCEVQGFPADMRMTAFCGWHLRAFQEMVFQKL